MEELTDKQHRAILDDWVKLGLLKEDYRPITKKAFLENMRVHTYGKGGRKRFIGIVGDHPKDGIYAFYPRFIGDTKKNFRDGAYKMYYSFVMNKEMDLFKCGLIQYGNKGIPLAFNDLGRH